MSARRNPSMSARQMRDAVALASEVERLREVLAGTAPAEGSWQAEALALRAEVERLLEVNGDLMTEVRTLRAATDHHCADTERELEQLRARDEKATAVVQAWNEQRARGTNGAAVFSTPFHALLDALARAHDPQDDGCDCCMGDPATVCDACGQHSCWAGRFMCEDAQTAGTTTRTAYARAHEDGGQDR